jgi:hypothetical protein
MKLDIVLFTAIISGCVLAMPDCSEDVKCKGMFKAFGYVPDGSLDVYLQEMYIFYLDD